MPRKTANPIKTMLSLTRTQRQTRIRQLIQELELIKDRYWKKYERARSEHRQNFYWNQYIILRNVIYRYYQSRFIYVNRFGEPDILQSKQASYYKQDEAVRIERGRNKFLNTHFYTSWFFGMSLSDDYGTYQCDYCNRTFHHSPSKITKAAKTVYECCCGYCTNEIIQRDHKELPYS